MIYFNLPQGFTRLRVIGRISTSIQCHDLQEVVPQKLTSPFPPRVVYPPTSWFGYLIFIGSTLGISRSVAFQSHTGIDGNCKGNHPQMAGFIYFQASDLQFSQKFYQNSNILTNQLTSQCCHFQDILPIFPFCLRTNIVPSASIHPRKETISVDETPCRSFGVSFDGSPGSPVARYCNYCVYNIYIYILYL